MKRVIIGSGEPWPEKRNPEFDRIYKKGNNEELGPAALEYISDLFSGKRKLEPECIPKDIGDVIYESYREIRKNFGKPHALYIPVRFELNFFSSESVMPLLRACYNYIMGFHYWGMRVVISPDCDELYIEYTEGEDRSKFLFTSA